MSETSPESEPNPAVVLLEARRAELTGGEQSIGVQEQQVEQMRAALDSALAVLAACEAELVALDDAIAILPPTVPPVVPPVDPELEV
ncbi:hypothetical protein [Nocardioides sp. BYT-33-1]|uniref:hypothetical protein n=1 Tax=Nocardioides sp. BYT-33-1 TaxID=3416952 RepID=UPI003F53007E